MFDWLFNPPWWLPAMLAFFGIVLFWNGNRQQETRLRNIGLGLIAATVLVLLASYFIDTDLERCVKRSKQLVRDVEQQNWPGMRGALDPNVTVSVLNSYQIYINRDETVAGARATVERYGVKNIRILQTSARQTDTLITVQMSLLSEHDRAAVPTINTGWEMEWQQTAGQWSLVRITNLKIGTLTGDAAGAQFPRPR